MGAYVDLDKVIFIQNVNPSDEEIDEACEDIEQLIFAEYLKKNGVAGF